MRKKVVIPFVIAGIAFVALMILLNRSKTVDEVPTYQTATVAKGTLVTSVEGTGNVEVGATSSISPSVSGKVTSLKVKVGDVVKKGQTLYYIDDDGELDTVVTKSSVSVEQSKQSLENSRAALLKAQNDYNDTNTQNSEDDASVTDAELALLQQQVVAAQAKVSSDEQSLKYSEEDNALQIKNAAKRRVTASVAGTVTAVNLANGDEVTAGGNSGSSGDESTIVIDDLSTMQTTVAINEVDASKVKVGQKASITFDAVEDLTLTGKVSEVGYNGTITSGVVTYSAVIVFDSIDARVLPSMTATASITTEAKTDVLTVPTTAIETSDDGTSTVSILEGGNPRQQIVTTGISNDTDTEITSGLKEGDTVVTGTVSNTNTAETSGAEIRGAGVITGGMGGGPGSAEAGFRVAM